MTTKIALEAARAAYTESLTELAAAAAETAKVGPTLWDHWLQGSLERTETCRRAYLEAHRADREADLRRALPRAE